MGHLRQKSTKEEEKQAYAAKLRWLKRYGEASAQAQFLQDQLAELQDAATRMTARLDGMPGAGRDTTRLARGVEKLDAARKKLDDQLALCMEYRLALVSELAKIRHPQAQEVLRRRYIEGQSYPEIAGAMGLVDRRVYQLHRLGVNRVLAEPDSAPRQEPAAAQPGEGKEIQ